MNEREEALRSCEVVMTARPASRPPSPPKVMACVVIAVRVTRYLTQTVVGREYELAAAFDDSIGQFCD